MVMKSLLRLVLNKILSLVSEDKTADAGSTDSAGQDDNTMVVGPLNSFTYGGIPVKLHLVEDGGGSIPLKFKLEADVSLEYAKIENKDGLVIFTESAQIRSNNDASSVFIAKSDPDTLRDISAICFNTVSRYYIMLQSSPIVKAVRNNVEFVLPPGGYKN
jgi:hypothetical protein